MINPKKVKIRRYERNPDFFEVVGGYGIGNKPLEPVQTMDLDYAKTIAGARVRIARKRHQGVIGTFEVQI